MEMDTTMPHPPTTRRLTPLLSGVLTSLWRADRGLTALGLAMLAAFVAFAAGVWLDPRTISGAPAWLKPAKFAISIAVYALTLAWVFSLLPAWPRTRRWAGRISVAMFVLEMVIIAAQAWRGTTSHFNVGTTVDGLLFTTMGVGIVVQTMAACAVAVVLWRQPFADRALGAALRLGMTLSIVGAAVAGLMTRPTPAQLELLRAGDRVTIVGAHTVGGPDGGPGMPGTGWSRQHGDIRVAHFLGLHALQVLPAFALLLHRRRTAPIRERLVRVAAGSYGTLFVLLLWQALRGQPLLQPDPASLAAFAAWAALTALAAARAAGAMPALVGRHVLEVGGVGRHAFFVANAATEVAGLGGHRHGAVDVTGLIQRNTELTEHTRPVEVDRAAANALHGRK